MPIVWAIIRMIRLRCAKDLTVLEEGCGSALRWALRTPKSFPYAKRLSDASGPW